jgi:large subunit ribosomal protein L7/L12
MSDIQLSADAQKIMEMVEKMPVLELSQLVKAMEEKFGVSAAAPAMMMAAAPAAGAAAAEEKSEFDIELADAGANKINVIKVVKELTGLGLADAKALVDGAPKVIKTGVKKEDANEAKKKIEEAGGKVNLK